MRASERRYLLIFLFAILILGAWYLYSSNGSSKQGKNSLQSALNVTLVYKDGTTRAYSPNKLSILQSIKLNTFGMVIFDTQTDKEVKDTIVGIEGKAKVVPMANSRVTGEDISLSGSWVIKYQDQNGNWKVLKTGTFSKTKSYSFSVISGDSWFGLHTLIFHSSDLNTWLENAGAPAVTNVLLIVKVPQNGLTMKVSFSEGKSPITVHAANSPECQVKLRYENNYVQAVTVQISSGFTW